MTERLRAARTVLGLARRAAPAALLGVVVVTALEATAPVVVAWLTKALVDRLAGEPHGPILAPALALAVAGVITAVLPHVDNVLRGEVGREVGLLSQDRLYRAVNGYAGLAPFEDPTNLDRLRMAQQCGQESPIHLISGALGLCRCIAVAAGFVVSLAVISPWLAAVAVAGAVPALAVELRVARANADAAVRLTPLERREGFFGMLLGSVQSAKEIRLFGIGEHLRDLMRADRRVINATHRRLQGRTALVQVAPALVSAAVAASGLFWAVRAAAAGDLSAGDVILFLAAIAAVQSGLAEAARSISVVHQHLLLFQHYVTLVTAGPDLPLLAPGAPARALRHEIELRDVWFRYSDDHPWVLRGVDLTIGRGESVALVGLNGAGKSTLVKLLCRFYDPTRGSIHWDGVDIRSMPVAELRARISAIFQDYMSYDVTAAHNIELGDLTARGDRARVRAAARRAGIDDHLVALPKGYDTLLTRAFVDPDDPDDGVLLSGGQWQRVALARGFLREQPDLLILDEPTAGLDPAAEHEIHEAAGRHRRDRTSLLISHRLNTIRDADTIVVLDAGTVAERGDHATLMAAGGRYARHFSQQAAGYAAETI